MPKSHVFPYGIAIRGGGALSVFPAAEVAMRSKTGEWLSLIFVVDSGATVSALPRGDAEVFGIIPEDGVSLDVGGVGGERIRGWQHIMKVRLFGREISLPVVFLDAPASPRVLGRAGVFDRFFVLFDEQKRRSGFLDPRSRAGKSASRILDAL